MTDFTKDLMKILKEVDSDMTKQNRYHYKQQIVKILNKDKEQNLIFKLLEKISEQQDEIDELKCCMKARSKHK